MKTRVLVILIFCIGLFQPDLFGQTKGYLKIIVNVQSVSVAIDGKSIGIVNPNELVIKEVTIGTHQVKASREGYQSQTKEIVISSSNEVKEITFELSKPQKFEVKKDVTSGTLGVDYGGVNVVVKYKGELVPAKVYIDDKFADNAPVNIKRLFAGDHTVRVIYNSIEKANYLKIEQNKINNLEIELVSKCNLDFTSQQTDIRGIVDNTTTINIPTSFKIDEGYHTLGFSKTGFFEATTNASFSSNNNYEIKINLSKSLPYINTSDVDRSYKQPFNAIDFYKPTTKLATNKKTAHIIAGICALGAGIFSTAVAEKNSGLAFFVGGGLGFLLGSGIGEMLAGKKSVPDEENIRYNNYEVPKILAEKNTEIIKYNSETDRLIKVKQQEKYNNEAITIIEK
jgi:hypothetical protein